MNTIQMRENTRMYISLMCIPCIKYLCLPALPALDLFYTKEKPPHFSLLLEVSNLRLLKRHSLCLLLAIYFYTIILNFICVTISITTLKRQGTNHFQGIRNA